MRRLEALSGALYRTKELKKAVRLGECAVALRDALPERYAGAVEPVELRRDVLFVRVENPVFLEELGLIRRDLVAAANERLSLPLADLVFRLGSVDRQAALVPERTTEEPLPDGEVREIESAAAVSGDAQIASCLVRAFSSLARRRERLVVDGFVPCGSCGRLLRPPEACARCGRAAELALEAAARFFRLRPWAGAEEFRAASGLPAALYAQGKARLSGILRARLEREEDPGRANRRALRGDLALYLSLVEGRLVPAPDPSLVARHFDPPHAERLAALGGAD